jgi:hypothetical protein
LFFWAAGVVGTYYVFHKPLSASLLIGFSPLVIAVGTLTVGHVLGGWVMKIVPGERHSIVSARGQLALTVGIGLGALGFIQLGLAAAGILSRWIGWGAVAIAIVILIRSGRWREWRAVVAWPDGDRSTQLLAAFCALTLGVALLHALAPPTAWDALVYHLTGPKWYLETRHLTHDRDLAYLGFPQWGGMLFMAAMQMGNDRAAAVMHWVFAPLTLMLLPDLLKPIAPRSGWLAAALLLSTTTLVMLAGWAYVEWMLMFAVTASMLAVVCASETGQRRWLTIAGVMAGLAFGAKYTAVGAIAGLGLAVAVCGRQAGGRRRAIASAMMFGVAAAITVLPWLIKNWTFTGNPVYPFFLPGKFWDPARAYWYGRGGTGLPLWRLLIAPWEMTVQGVEGFNGYGATIGPLWLVLLPALPFGWERWSSEARRRLTAMLVVAGAACVVWLAQVGWSGLLGQSRLLFGVFPLMACLSVAAFEGLAPPGEAYAQGGLNVRRLIGAVIALVLVLSAVEWAQSVLNDSPLSAIAGAQSEQDYLRAKLGWYAVAIEEINALPPESKVMFLWEPRTYHCVASVDCEPDALLDRWWHARRLGMDADTVAAQWRAEGVTHVLVFEAGRAVVQEVGFDPFTAADWEELLKFRSRLALVSDFGGAYQLYAMNNEQ